MFFPAADMIEGLNVGRFGRSGLAMDLEYHVNHIYEESL